MTIKIATIGFHHETNTFAATKTTYDDFVKADGWPALSIGHDVIANLAGFNLPTTGFIEESAQHDIQIQPILWCSAQPAGYVTTDAFERITTAIINGLKTIEKPDFIFLDLHGAMACESFDDAGTELLLRIKNIYPDTPVFASLDFHANVSERFFQMVDYLRCYRHYPHTDMAETGQKVLRAIIEYRRSEGGLHKSFARIPFLIPLPAQCTLTSPAHDVRQYLDNIEYSDAEFLSCSFTYGFPPSDTAHTGPSVFAYSVNPDCAKLAVENIANNILSLKNRFSCTLLPPDEAVKDAISTGIFPVIIADTQDNPGAGASSDVMDIAFSLLQYAGNKRCIFASIHDADAAEKACNAGVGATIEIALGGKSNNEPLLASFMVIATGDGEFMGHGSMYGGSHMHLGKTARLRLKHIESPLETRLCEQNARSEKRRTGVNWGVNEDSSIAATSKFAAEVEFLVISHKQQAADRGIFHHLGSEPANYDIMVLKSSVHFMADFNPRNFRIIHAASSGINVVDTDKLQYSKLTLHK